MTAPTGAAPILVEPNGQNRIIVVKGANDLLTAADVDAAALDLRRVERSSASSRFRFETVYHAVRFARAHQIRCIVNPAPAVPAQLAHSLGADLFIPNETEAEQLTGQPVRLEGRAACAAKLLHKGFMRVVLTLGKRGSFVAEAARHQHLAPFTVAYVDTSGAGDAFIGSLAVFLAEGVAEQEALARANMYAALSTMRIGTQKSFARRADFETEWELRRKGTHHVHSA